MFCNKCGNEIPEGMTTCPNCQPQTENATTSSPMDTIKDIKSQIANGENPFVEADTNSGKKKISKVGIGAIAAVVVVVVLCFIIFGGRSAEGVVEDYISACEDKDGEAMWNLYPDEFKEALLDNDKYDNEKKAIDAMEDDCKELRKEYGLGDDYDDYEIIDEVELDDGDIDDIIDSYEKVCDVELDITAATTFEVDLDYDDVEDDEDVDDNFTITVIKVGGSWYLSPLGF